MAADGRTLVKRKVMHSWPDDFEEVMGMLDMIDTHGGSADVLARVQLAVLMLSHGRRDQIPSLVDMATTDYRDVLVGAEYPDQMRWGFVTIAELEPAEQKAYRAAKVRDQERYAAWLDKPGV